jgi:hypothetical protein
MIQVKMIKNWRNLKISYILTLFDLQWLKLTFKLQNFYIFGISEQFAIKKSTISKYRATSIFDLHMRIFNLQSLGLPTNLKKKKLRRLTGLSRLRVMFCPASHRDLFPVHYFSRCLLIAFVL